MKYKKMIIVPTLLLSLGIVGCDKDEPAPVHEHIFDRQIVDGSHLCTEVSCLAPESYYFSCVCGANGEDTFKDGEPRGHVKEYSYSSNTTSHWIKCKYCDQTFDLEDHDLGDVVALEQPTCTEAGSGYARCKTCNKMVDQVIPATGHAKSTEWTYDENQHWHACANGCTVRYDISSHKYGEVVVDKAATCIAQGKGHKVCGDCGYVKYVDLPIDSQSHNLVTENVPSTCTAIAYTHTYCTRCSYEIDTPDPTSTMKEHNYKIQITKEATSNSCGTRVCTCEDCGHIEVETIPHTASHNYRNYVAISDLGHARQCSYEGCDAVEKNVYQHNYNKLVIDREPDGTTAGHKHWECGTCGYHQASSEEDFVGISVESIAFTVNMPISGGSFNKNFATSTTGVVISDKFCAFFDENSQKIDDRDVTSEDIGKTFKAVIYARPRSGYFFRLNDDSVPLITATLNGESVTCPKEFNSGMWSGGEFYYIFSYEFTIE